MGTGTKANICNLVPAERTAPLALHRCELGFEAVLPGPPFSMASTEHARCHSTIDPSWCQLV